MSLIETSAVLFGLACVWLTVRQSIWCWPTGLVMVTLYIFIFFDARLYSDMGLQFVYIFMQIYGWHNWLHGGQKHSELKVTRLSRLGAAAWSVIAMATATALGYTMERYTDADFAFADAVTTTLSLIAQWLMAKKILESWLIWITVDIISVAIYALKGLSLTAGLYMVFLALATIGYFAWRRTL
ncbi:MAG: nicotinamide riboside transporter PnuC [Nitrospinota bacterium]|nr:nicotinamide riboside transporter PnuC [Nitrospinota bacterium]